MNNFKSKNNVNMNQVNLAHLYYEDELETKKSCTHVAFLKNMIIKNNIVICHYFSP